MGRVEAAEVRALLPFLLINLAGFILQGYRFAARASGSGFFCQVAVWLALLAVLTSLTVALWLLLHTLARTGPGRRALFVVAPILLSAAHVFLFVDATLFRLFRFHFNGLAAEVLFTPGGFQTMEIPSRELVQFGALL